MSDHVVNLHEISPQFEGMAAKVSVNLRRVDISSARSLVQNKVPEVGDVLLAKIKTLGDHTSIQSIGGRTIELHEGDKILVPYGNRYAVEQYEAHVPPSMTTCHLVSKGGLASQVVSEKSALQNPTIIQPIGILAGVKGKVLNTRDFSLMPKENVKFASQRPTTIAVFGTGMDAGKTTSAAMLVKAFVRAGHKVGFGKLTGTGAFSDIHKPEDAGAIAAVDFVDMGYPSTYKLPTPEILQMLDGIHMLLALKGADICILEIADGVFQIDNQKLLRSETFKNSIDGVFVAADSGLAALSAVRELKRHGFGILGVGGVMTNKPLTVIEFNQHIDKYMVEFGTLPLSEIRKKKTANLFLQSIMSKNLSPRHVANDPVSENTANLRREDLN